MASSYNPGGNTVLDDIRAELFDTGTDGFDMALDDAEIARVVANVSPLSEAKATLAVRLSIFWGKQATDWAEANRKEAFQDRSAMYLKLAARFRSETTLDDQGLGGGSFTVGNLENPGMSDFLDYR